MVFLIITDMSIDDISNRDDVSKLLDYKVSSIDDDYMPLPELFTSVEDWEDSTNLKCWNHHEQFEGVPKFIPVKWNYLDENVQIKTFGCFCSWNCAKTFLITVNCTEIPEYSRSNMMEKLFKLAKLFDPSIKSIDTITPYYKQVEYVGY